MDPYLEGSHWSGVHSQLCAEIARQLAPRLRPKYVALTNERFVLDTPEDVAGDPDNYLDLQQALTTVYDLIGYDLVVNYERAPEIVLSSEIATWAENRVREWFRKKKKGTQ